MSKPLDAEAQSVLDTAHLIHDAGSVDASCKQLADALAAELRGRNPVILPLMLGGLYAATQITRHFDFPFELDVLQATRYHNATQGSDLLWKVMPSIDLHNRVVLVIDDILDHGHTLKAVEEDLRAQEPEALLVAVLVEKNTPS
ncbi:MAG: phosphoribosyltransferase family protein, partial [Salinisphaeraceae bacterium]|nr:phosphoribosyltransferase family protein [Salinisphaeraceae bacterium]